MRDYLSDSSTTYSLKDTALQKELVSAEDCQKKRVISTPALYVENTTEEMTGWDIAPLTK